MKPGISAIIIVKDQRDLLKICLKSIHNWVDQIVIIDLGSTQDIRSLATFYKAKFVEHKSIDIVERVRQESLQYAAHEYVLFIDPDESIPSALAQDLVAKIGEGQYDYFTTPRQNIVFGKWVKHSRWWPDLQTRVFRVGKVTWGKELHAPAKPSGSGYTYEGDERYSILHANYRTLDEWITKNMRYAKADAHDRVLAGTHLSLSGATKLSVSELISRFFLDKGYLDGMHGLVLSVLQSFYYFLVYGYYWQEQGFKGLETEATIRSFPRAWFGHGFSQVMHWDKATTFAKSIKEKLVRRMIA